MRAESNDKQLKSGASKLFSPGQVPLKCSHRAPGLVIGGTGVLSDVGHEDLRGMKGGRLILGEEQGEHREVPISCDRHQQRRPLGAMTI